MDSKILYVVAGGIILYGLYEATKKPVTPPPTAPSQTAPTTLTIPLPTPVMQPSPILTKPVIRPSPEPIPRPIIQPSPPPIVIKPVSDVGQTPTETVNPSIYAYDIRNDLPIVNARVQLISVDTHQTYTEYTDQSGTAYFKNIPKGTYYVNIYAKYGYKLYQYSDRYFITTSTTINIAVRSLWV